MRGTEILDDWGLRLKPKPVFPVIPTPPIGVGNLGKLAHEVGRKNEKKFFFFDYSQEEF
jgi:hypothetical protein